MDVLFLLAWFVLSTALSFWFSRSSFSFGSLLIASINTIYFVTVLDSLSSYTTIVVITILLQWAILLESTRTK